MAKTPAQLHKSFLPENYQLTFDGPLCRLNISGIKLPPPSKRISLHSQKIRIVEVAIIKNDKRGDIEYEVARINYLPSFGEARLHTKETLFPGKYKIVIAYELPIDKIELLKSTEAPNRELMPSVDEPEAWAHAKIEIRS